MPEVITGISLLLLFIMMAQLIGWPGQRGFTTITIAHITFSMTYVATIVQSRLASMDRSVEEAAMDLGSKPLAGAVRRHAADHRAGHRVGLAARLHPVARRRGDHQLHHRPRRRRRCRSLIFSKVRLGVTPDINALATIIIMVVGAGVALAGLADVPGRAAARARRAAGGDRQQLEPARALLHRAFTF